MAPLGRRYSGNVYTPLIALPGRTLAAVLPMSGEAVFRLTDFNDHRAGQIADGSLLRFRFASTPPACGWRRGLKRNYMSPPRAENSLM
jgi:hypothetical protein